MRTVTMLRAAMTTTFALGAMCLVIAAALVLVRMHTLPTGLDPRRDAISDYGTTTFHVYYRAMVVMIGAGAGCLAWALDRSGDVRTSGVVWLWIFAGARILIAGFMTVRPGRRVTLEAQIHLVLAAAAFVAIAFAAPIVSADLDLAVTLSRLVVGAAVATLASRAIRPLTPVFGLVERILYAVFLAWLLVVASSLAT